MGSEAPEIDRDIAERRCTYERKREHEQRREEADGNAVGKHGGVWRHV